MNEELVIVWAAAGTVGYGAGFVLAPDPTGIVALAIGTAVTVSVAAVGQQLLIE